MSDRCVNALTSVLVLLIAVFLPLFLNSGGYESISYAKCLFLVIILIILISGISVYFVRDILCRRHLPQIHIDLIDAAVIAYMVLSIISGFVSRNPNASFYGYGICCGALGHICGGLSYFWISRNCKISRKLIQIVVAVWTFIYVWSAACMSGANLFGLYDGMIIPKAFNFISCLGFSNVASGFCCMTVPFIGVLFIRCDTDKESVLYGLSFFFGTLASFCICCDGMMFGFLFSLAFIVPWAMSDYNRHRKFWEAVFLCSIALIAYRLLLIYGYVYREECVSVSLAGHWTGEILMAVSGAMIAVLGHRKGLSVPINLRRLMSAGILTIFAVILLCTFYLGFTDPHFGTERGAIWKGSVWAFRTYTPLEKLFGLGNGCFHTKLMVAVNMILYRPILDNSIIYFWCHNLFLHTLLAQGILGLIVLLIGIYAVFRKAAVSYREREFDKAFPAFVAIVAYLGQSMVISSFTVIVMLLFLMLAIFKGALMKKEVR